MMYPLVTDLAADGIPVAVICRVLGFSKQGYYRWRSCPVTDRDWEDAHLVNAARDIHDDDPAFGYRFIADELPEKRIMAGENRVQRLCRDHGIWSVFSKKRGLNRKPGPPVHDDLVERDFTADAPNELWLTDIMEHPTAEGKIYLGSGGSPGRNSDLPSRPGSSGPTTAGDGKDGWENSRQSNMKQSTGPRSQRPKTPSQQKPGQSPQYPRVPGTAIPAQVPSPSRLRYF